MKTIRTNKRLEKRLMNIKIRAIYNGPVNEKPVGFEAFHNYTVWGIRQARALGAALIEKLINEYGEGNAYLEFSHPDYLPSKTAACFTPEEVKKLSKYF